MMRGKLFNKIVSFMRENYPHGGEEYLNVQEAVKRAIEVNGYITGGDFKNKIFIKPTDSADRCICCIDKNRSRRGWQPSASDLVSNSWEVVTEKEFLSLSTNINI